MNSQTQPRTYYVVRKHVHNGKIQTLDQSDFIKRSIGAPND